MRPKKSSKQASEAYQVLSDADKRAAYDRYGHAGLGGQGFGGSPFAGGVDIGDIFGDLFGEMFQWAAAAQRGSRQQRGDDLRFDLTIDFEDAIFRHRDRSEDSPPGNLPDLPRPRQRLGPRAQRVQPVPGPRAAPLPAGILLGGAHLRRLRRHGLGDRRSLHDLPRRDPRDQRDQAECEGSAGRGRWHAHPLRRRRRRGARRRTQGRSLRCASIRPHDFFERHGYDLHCVIPISFPQAALGAEFEIPGIDGPMNIKIPEGTQSGEKLRVRGRGVPYLNEKGNGDLIVKVLVQIPRKLNRAQRELVAKLAETHDGGQQADLAGADGEDEGPVQLGSSAGVSGLTQEDPTVSQYP